MKTLSSRDVARYICPLLRYHRPDCAFHHCNRTRRVAPEYFVRRVVGRVHRPLTDPKGLTDATIRATDELLDGFVVAYRSVNPAGGAIKTSPIKYWHRPPGDARSSSVTNPKSIVRHKFEFLAGSVVLTSCRRP